MNSKQVTYIFFAFVAILGWNAFLIQRDDKLFRAYYKEKAKVEQCASPQTGTNPPCAIRKSVQY